MASPRVKLNIRGIRAILTGPEVTAEIAKRVHRGARAAGDGFEARMQMRKAHTARGVVRTADREGRVREAKNKVLIQTLDAMR